MLKVNDPKIIDDGWRWAIEAWHDDGDISPMLFFLKRRSELPEFVREFLADVLTGKIKRPRKRPSSPRIPHDGRFGNEGLVRLLYQKAYAKHAMEQKLKRHLGRVLQGGDSAKELALKEVAQKLKMKPGTVSHIVHPRQGKKPRDFVTRIESQPKGKKV